MSNKPSQILIVEDDRFLARAYEHAFAPLDCKLTVLFDGEGVTEAVERLQPVIILLDILLPKKDGFTILKELKANPKTKSAPVVIASNLGQDEEVKKGLALGADAYIVKSETSMADVIQTVKKYLA